jgi:tRNA modification GTPase
MAGKQITDTIAAIATPPGTGGVAMLRISGPQARAIARVLTSQKTFKPNTILPATIHAKSGTELDRGMIAFFKNPQSYTGDDIIEIYCHGSYFLAQQILGECLRAGARLAGPGEFTKRAFLAGKIDLTQVEAVAEMIAAKSSTAAQLALKHLEGDVSRAIRGIRDTLVKTLAEIEACLDYPDELAEPPRASLTKQIQRYKKTIVQLLADAHAGLIIRDGIRIALVGKTNVGKSSLFNRLAKASKAIVTDVHGTTRDYLEAAITIKDVALTLVDTAGIRDSQDQIEIMGIARSKEHTKTADLVLFVLDATTGIAEEDKKIIAELPPDKTIWIINKADENSSVANAPQDALYVSAKTGQGLAALEKTILKQMDVAKIDMSKHIYISSLRQKEQLIRIQEIFERALNSIKTVGYIDLLAVELKEAVVALGEITGDEVSEEVITHIFSNFCVGK